MNPELDRELCERYPAMFVDRHASVFETGMCWGFCVDDGWYDLIDVLCQQLQQECDDNSLPQIVAVQVKEKMGTLRFRVKAASDRQRAMIRYAETLSERICGICGRSSVAWPKSYRAIAKDCGH